MLADPVIATVVVLALLTFSEIVSISTRARVPMLLVALLGYLVLLWLRVIPQDLLTNSTMPTIGSIMICPLIIHMGTLIPLRTIRKQWRAVCINLTGLIITAALILIVGSLVLGYQTAAATVGPATGGTIAFLVTSAKLKELGLVSLVALPALVLAFHSLVGMPLAANILRRYVRRYVQTIDARAYVATAVEPEVRAHAASVGAQSGVKFLFPEKYQTNLTFLFLLFFGGAIATVLGKYTGINYTLWCLIIGLIGAKVGFYQERMLERANAFGLAIVGLILVVLPSMNSVTVTMFVTDLPLILLIVALSIVGLVVGGYIGSKIFRWDPRKGIPVALTATFGFPGDYLICEEISRSEASGEVPKQVIMEEILSPMLIGGFTSVTIASVVIASIVMATL